MLRLIKLGLLVLCLILVQAGALAHGLGHGVDADGSDPASCEQCLAFAPVGAGLTGSPLAWSSPPFSMLIDVADPATSPALFLPCYRSRAPPVCPGQS